MLKNKVVTGMVLLITMISPTIAMAQEMPSGKWWHDPRMSKQLNLNDAEKDRLDEEFRNSRRKLIELKSDVEMERFELGNLLERKELDEAAVYDAYTKAMRG